MTTKNEQFQLISDDAACAIFSAIKKVETLPCSVRAVGDAWRKWEKAKRDFRERTARQALFCSDTKDVAMSSGYNHAVRNSVHPDFDFQSSPLKAAPADAPAPSNKIEKLVLESLRVYTRDRLNKAQSIVDGLHFSCEALEQPEKFQKAYDLLADAQSKKLFEWFVKYRVAVLLSGSKDAAAELFPPAISSRRWSELCQQAQSLPEAALEQNLVSDLVENFLLDGYNLGGVCGVEPSDWVLDLGAFNGNSSIVFSRAAGPEGKVFAFEPNPSMQEILARNITKMGCDNIAIIPCGAGDRPGQLRFVSQGAASRFDPFGNIEVEVKTVDDFVEKAELPRVDFIKLDVEGFEMPALRGAAGTIRKFRPKLAISVYHLHYDAYAIPLFINDLSPWYRFYLRHNAVIDGEMVLFCQPIES